MIQMMFFPGPAAGSLFRLRQAGSRAEAFFCLGTGRARRQMRSIRSLFLCLGFLAHSPHAGAQVVPLPNIPSRTFTITDPPYNAVGDGLTTNTTAIQNAIKDCTTAGGGTILVPAGTFLSGPITLGKSNNLQLASGAVLRMLPFGSYPTNAPAFITASSLTDVEISGSGSVDGQGPPWLAAFATNGNLVRPVMLNMTKCTRLAVLGVSFTNAPTMHLIVKNNTSATIQGVTIFTSFPSKNTDGIDLAAVGAYVEGDNISDGDDVIAIGSGGSFSANIFITNCAFGNGHGLSMGSSISGGISNVTVINCSFNGTQYGLKGKSTRGSGGLAQNINYLNVTLTNIQFPISFSSYYPNNPSDPSQDPGGPAQTNTTTPYWWNTTFSNVTATAAPGFAVGSIWGLPEAPVSNMVFHLVTLTGQTGLQVYHARAVQFSGDSSINVQNGSRLLTYDTQLSSQLQLTNQFNQLGVATDGLAFTGGGLDGNGSAYSATALGLSLSPGGFLFTFGPVGTNSAVSAAGQTLNVPVGLRATNYQALTFLGTAVNGSQSAQPFVVHYTDGTTSQFNQSLSDWGSPQHFPGEWIAVTMNHRDTDDGSTQSVATYLFQYSFPLDSTRLVSGITLPNNPNVLVMAALVTVSPTNTAPMLAAIPDQTVTAGSTLVFTNTASDTDQPPQRLTFSLPVGPVGANVDPDTGIFTWRPTIAQAGTTNALTVAVNDDATPSLGATQSFNVIVNRPAQPSIQQAAFTNGQFQLLIGGVSGPDYLIQASTDLASWTTIYTNLSPPVPFLWIDTNSFPQRFYRIQLGP